MAFLQPSPSSSLTSRESFLEKKISILDKRLTNVEKFIELRFRKNCLKVPKSFVNWY